MFARKIVARACSSRSFFLTAKVRKDVVLPVPGMGDSITEGTLINLTKQIGDYIAVDEIVAVIETDKVSVDIRSPIAGTLKAVHVQLNDNVNVGAPLLTIDDEATGSSTPTSSPSAAKPAPAPAPAAKPSPAPAPTPAKPAPAPAAPKSHARIPSIRFTHGKRSVIEQQMGLYGSSTSSSTVPVHADYNSVLDSLFPSKVTTNSPSLGPSYGRPPLSSAEAFSITSGGAYTEIAPPKEKAKK